MAELPSITEAVTWMTLPTPGRLGHASHALIEATTPTDTPTDPTIGTTKYRRNGVWRPVGT